MSTLINRTNGHWEDRGTRAMILVRDQDGVVVATIRETIDRTWMYNGKEYAKARDARVAAEWRTAINLSEGAQP